MAVAKCLRGFLHYCPLLIQPQQGHLSHTFILSCALVYMWVCQELLSCWNAPALVRLHIEDIIFKHSFDAMQYLLLNRWLRAGLRQWGNPQTTFWPPCFCSWFEAFLKSFLWCGKTTPSVSRGILFQNNWFLSVYIHWQIYAASLRFNMLWWYFEVFGDFILHQMACPHLLAAVWKQMTILQWNVLHNVICRHAWLLFHSFSLLILDHF